MYEVTVTMPRTDLEALLDRAGREAPRNPTEKRATEDLREHLQRAALAEATAAAEASNVGEQLSLFDTSEYDT
jgi:hypothetical protein